MLDACSMLFHEAPVICLMLIQLLSAIMVKVTNAKTMCSVAFLPFLVSLADLELLQFPSHPVSPWTCRQTCHLVITEKIAMFSWIGCSAIVACSRASTCSELTDRSVCALFRVYLVAFICPLPSCLDDMVYHTEELLPVVILCFFFFQFMPG